MHSPSRPLSRVAVAVLALAVACAAPAQLLNPQPEPGRPAAPDANTQKSMIAYAQGRALLQSGKTAEAVEAFKKAIVLRPDDGNYRYALAQAYAKLDKPRNRWFQLRQAVRLRPDLQAAVADFNAMWDAAVAAGALDVGRAPEQVKHVLGEADLINTETAVTTWQYGYMTVNFQDQQLASVMDLRAINQFQPPLQGFVLDLDQQSWKLKQQFLSGQLHRYEFATAEDPIADPDGLVTLERRINLALNRSARETMEQMRLSLLAQFPEAHWTVLEQSEDDVLFEWRLDADGAPTQHEIARLVKGERDIHRLAYTARHIARREAWLRRLRDATLEPLQAASG